MNLANVMRLTVGCRKKLAASPLTGGACVVNLVSMSASRGARLVPGYAAAKSGLLALTRELALTWRKDGIRVNAVAPGYTQTERSKRNRAGKFPPEIVERQILQRPEEATDPAAAVLFLASPESDFMTGQTLVVDGGLSLPQAGTDAALARLMAAQRPS